MGGVVPLISPSPIAFSLAGKGGEKIGYKW